MLAKDNMPLNTTEKEGFIHFMKKAAPMYKIPSRTTITNLIKTKYEVLSGLVKTKLSQIEFLTITTDIWTDTVNTKSYLGMTVHFLNISNVALDSVTIGVLELSASHTANNISIWFEQLIEEWGIKKNQVFTVVTDNGANILSAVKKTFSQEKHLPCFAHTLNLVSERALENLSDVQVLIHKIKSVVTYFKHSVAASDDLKKLCNYKLKQSVPTRWNSIYYMIERFILCSNHIASVLINMRGGPTMLTADEIDLAKEMLSVLRPMEVATKELCGQKYVTGSKVIPLINCLIKKTESINLSNPIALTLKQAMLDNLYKRFGRMEEISLLSVATILDPRFKTIHLNNPNSSARAIRLIKNKITEIKNSSDDTNSSSCHGSSDDDGDRHDNLWSVHTKKAASKTSEQSEERIPTDLKHYLSQSTINLGEDILKYWDQNGNRSIDVDSLTPNECLSYIETVKHSEITEAFSQCRNIKLPSDVKEIAELNFGILFSLVLPNKLTKEEFTQKSLEEKIELLSVPKSLYLYYFLSKDDIIQILRFFNKEFSKNIETIELRLLVRSILNRNQSEDDNDSDPDFIPKPFNIEQRSPVITRSKKRDTELVDPNNINNRLETFNMSKPIFFKPEFYSGEPDECVNDFIENYNLISAANEWSDDKKIMYAPIYLKKSAKAFYQNYIISNPTPSWSHFELALKEYFMSPGRARMLKAKLTNRKLKLNETVSQFLADF
ncbi:hypothetical protein QTP88_015539 [Uroleucon formosanum]